jgi:hypothetical protein
LDLPPGVSYGVYFKEREAVLVLSGEPRLVSLAFIFIMAELLRLIKIFKCEKMVDDISMVSIEESKDVVAVLND